MPELLLGCGNQYHKQVWFPDIPKNWTDLVTVDIDPETNPSYVHDLEVLPYPFTDNEFDEVHAYEILEHTGQQGDWRFFFNQFYEIWRIMKPGAYFMGTVPQWDSPWAWGDPGHKRLITSGTLTFLSQKEYQAQVGKTPMTDYRHVWDGDFDLIAINDEDDHRLGFVLQAVK